MVITKSTLLGEVGTTEDGSILDTIRANIGEQFDKALTAVKSVVSPSTSGSSGIKASSGGAVLPDPDPGVEPPEHMSSAWAWVVGLVVIGAAGFGIYKLTKKRRSR